MYVPVPDEAVAVMITVCPASIFTVVGERLTVGSAYTYTLSADAEAVTPFESVTVTPTVPRGVPGAVGVHVIDAEFANVQPRVAADCDHEYVEYDPLPPVAVAVNVTVWPISTFAGLGEMETARGAFSSMAIA